MTGNSSSSGGGNLGSHINPSGTPTSTSSSSSSSSSRKCSWHARTQQWLAAAGTSLGQELSGSLGDLGTFLPLVVALSATIKLDLGTTLLFSGLYNVVSGITFQIPMCVQPMKTVAAVALASPGLSLPEVMSAGLFLGGVMLLLGLTGAMGLVNRAVPGSVVRGIQLAVGLQLAQKGVTQVFRFDSHTYRQLWGVEGCVLGVLAAMFLLVTTLPEVLAASTAQQQQQQQQERQCDAANPEQGCCHDKQQEQQHGDQHLHHQQQDVADIEHLEDGRQPDQHGQQQQQQQQQQHLDTGPQAALSSSSAAHLQAGSCGCSSACSSSSQGRLPSALILVALGLLLTVIASPHVLSQLQLGPSKTQLYLPTWQVFKDGVLKAGLAQLPLTSLNSVIAVTYLAGQLFPERVAVQGWRWQPGAIAVSVGAMNLVGCWFGAMPCCHGSGGLAAQYKFGARTGLAPVLLGGMKVALALLFGSSLLQLLQLFPQPLLGSLLLLSGLELAAAARKETDQRGYCFMLLTAAAIMGLKNTAVGFAVGMGGFGVVAAHAWVCRVGLQWWQQRKQRQYVLVPTADKAQGCPV